MGSFFVLETSAGRFVFDAEEKVQTPPLIDHPNLSMLVSLM
jgi:hypothetical protein